MSGRTDSATDSVTAVSSTAVPRVGLLDPTFYVDLDAMHEAFTWLRANDPVHYDESSGMWGITRHADVLRVERDDATFSSHGSYRSRLSQGEDNMIAQDNPRHLEQRRLVIPKLAPAGVRKLEPKVRSLVTELVDAICDAGGSVEVVEALAAQLPARLTAELLGFPEERWSDLKSWSERLMRIDSVTEDPEIASGFIAALGEFGQALNAAVGERRGCPADDLISTCANAQLHDGPLPDSAIFNETGLFISGGSETTRTVIARGLATFCEHPDQWELLAREPERIPDAVEELLRWVTPLNNMFRRATTPADVGGAHVPEGARLVLLYPSANRDEAVFDEPFRFDVTRHPNHHLAFGSGTHFCVGANLARFELRVLFEELTKRITDLHVVTPPDIEKNIFAGAVRSFELGYTVR
jgi:cholest-4-en-3-one 26-monooxygenase